MLCAVCALAQTVEGTVVSSVTGNGIAGVKVEIFLSSIFGYSATTNAEGHFRMDDVKDGAYGLIYSSPDYWWDDGARGIQEVQVAKGVNLPKLEARMTPLAKASGRVVNGKGEAVAGAGVWMAGSRQSLIVQTDAKGMFEQRLLSGTYTLSVIPPAGLKAPDPEPDSDRVLTWVRTYYPGVTAPEAAAKIALQPGVEVTGLEVKLLTAPAHTVRGVLLNPDGKPAPKVTISLEGLPQRRTETLADGRFEFPAVVNGEWPISAEVESGGVRLRAVQWCEVAGKDVEDLKLRLGSPFTIRGKFVLEPPLKVAPRLPLAIHLDFYLARADRDNGVLIRSSSRNSPAYADANGNFVLENVYPGVYRILTTNWSPEYYLESIRLGEEEVSTREPEISSGVAPITVVYKANGGSVRGTAEKCASGGVMVIPQDPALRRPGFLHSMNCDASNRYEIPGVRPGDYYVLAFSGNESEAWYATRFDNEGLLNQANKVTVRAGEISSVDLQAIPQPPN